MQGLTTAEAEARLAQYGPNELPQATQRRFIYIFIQMLREPTFALLIAGGIIYLVLGDRVEALSLLFFALISIVISSVQESRSETVLRALKDLASPRALVIRDDKQQHIAGRDVVPDDVILIEEGNRVVADAILITANDLLMDESLLTGESIPVNKSACPPNNITDNCSLDQTHRIFAGTLVVSGNAKAIIHKTGAHTEMGNIGLMLTNIESDEPHIQLQMRRLVRDFSILGILTAILALILFGIFRRDWIEALLGAIALGMSLVPEEFLLVITVFMAMGAWRISQIRVLTRRSAAKPIRSDSVVSSTNRLIADRSASAALGSTRKPVSPSSTISGKEQTLVAMTGVPHAIASKSTSPRSSAFVRHVPYASRCTDGRTHANAPAYSARRSRSVASVMNSMCLPDARCLRRWKSRWS